VSGQFDRSETAFAERDAVHRIAPNALDLSAHSASRGGGGGLTSQSATWTVVGAASWPLQHTCPDGPCTSTDSTAASPAFTSGTADEPCRHGPILPT